MSVFEFDISDSFSPYDNDVQGNKFNGLEYDDVVTDGLFLDETFLLSSFEILDDGLLFEESFAPEHFCFISDSVFSSDSFLPSASLLFSAVQIAHRKKVTPVDIYWVSLDVIHGPDVFYEELSETFFLFSLDIIANMYFDTLYDDFFMDLYPPYQTFVDVARVVFLQSSDLCVMQNSITPEYRLNNLCDEIFFVFPLPIRGFPHVVKSQLGLSDSVVFAHARTVETALVALAACGSTWRGQETISEAFVSYDTSVDEKYYEYILAESVSFVSDNGLLPIIHELVKSDIRITEGLGTALGVYVDLVDSLAASLVSQLTYSVSEEFDDGFSMGSEALSSHLARDIVLDTIDFLHEASPSLILMEALVDSLIQHSESGVES